MGEEADPGEYDLVGGGGRNAGDGGDGERVLEWEIGLPSTDDLTPLSQSLVPPELASAFSITPEPVKTILDVHRASQTTLSTLRRQTLPSSSSAAAAAVNSFAPFSSPGPTSTDDPILLEDAGKEDQPPDDPPAVSMDDADSSALPPENSTDDPSARTLKRPRLVWTPQLHKRFVDVVAHLGIKNAVPKTIMQLMNVEGLTRENVASHLQKYRLYLKRMQGLSNEGPSASDHLFASTPVPQSLHEQLPPPPPPQQPPHVPMPMPMPYAVPTMIPMPMFGMPHHHGHNGPVGMVPVNNHQGGGAYHGFEAHHHYGAFEERPKDWPGGNNKFGSIVGYPRILPNDK